MFFAYVVTTSGQSRSFQDHNAVMTARALEARGCKWEHYLPEDLERVRSVQPSGLLKLDRESHERLAHEEDSECAEKTGQDDTPDAVEQTQALHNLELRNEINLAGLPSGLREPPRK